MVVLWHLWPLRLGWKQIRSKQSHDRLCSCFHLAVVGPQLARVLRHQQILDRIVFPLLSLRKREALDLQLSNLQPLTDFPALAFIGVPMARVQRHQQICVH